MWMVILNALVICFLIALGVEYIRPDGLGDTFYTLKDDFFVAKNTMQSVCMMRHRMLAVHSLLVASFITIGVVV